MWRWLLGGFVLVTVAATVDLAVAQSRGSRPWLSPQSLIAEVRAPIVVGLIHSQTGPLAISERSLVDAEVLALEEINARGGIAGLRVTWEVADGRSDPTTFAAQALRLIERDKVDVIVGGWTGECRKAVLEVVEERQGLFLFPGNFEGLERSPQIVYAGGSDNQVFPPAVRWCFDSLKAKRFFVVGTEEVWSRVVAELSKDVIKAGGGTLAGEAYLPMVGGDAEAVVAAIRSAKPDVVLNMMVGDSNIPFYSAFRKAGLTPETLPILAFNVSEGELKQFPPGGDATGHYAAWSYFQSIDRPENLAFIRRFKARYGEGRVISDAMVAAYNGLMIWAQVVDEVGTGDPKIVSTRFDRQSVDAPEGIVTIDATTRAAWRPFYLGKARSDGQFEVVWSLTKPNAPITYIATRSMAQWQSLLNDLKSRWGGRWSVSESARPDLTRSSK